MKYFVKTPGWLQWLYPRCIWQMPANNKTIYLSFDDGPHPEATPFVLSHLKKFNARATFFCIGKNVVEYPAIYQQIIANGHAVGNHTHNHLNGWKTNDYEYYKNIAVARAYIDSTLFRPPYGKATRRQLKGLAANPNGLTPVMWTVLSGDFDAGITAEKCLQNVIQNTSDGAILVFHDSTKAFDKLQYVLPKMLSYFSERGFCFEKIEVSSIK
jgi:peptidoglycan/xylan/chitin deacetylase (PgdA/CDA1 family)